MTKRADASDINSPNSLNTNPTSPRHTSDVGDADGFLDPVAKGDGPLPEELTGRASATGEDLVALMANGSAEHLTDGFRGGNGDDPETDAVNDDDADDLN